MVKVQKPIEHRLAIRTIIFPGRDVDGQGSNGAAEAQR